jgi:hypothetical protein
LQIENSAGTFVECQFTDQAFTAVIMNFPSSSVIRQCTMDGLKSLHAYGNGQALIEDSRLPKGISAMNTKSIILRRCTLSGQVNLSGGSILSCADCTLGPIYLQHQDTTSRLSSTLSENQYDPLRQILQERNWESADKSTIEILRRVTGAQCIDRKAAADSVHSEVLKMLNTLWVSSGGGTLAERPWVRDPAAGVTTYVGISLLNKETWLLRRLKEVGLTGEQAYHTAKAETQQQETTPQQATIKVTNQKERNLQEAKEAKQEPQAAGAQQKQATHHAKTKSDEVISQADFGKEYLALVRKRLVAQNFEWLENVRHDNETFLCVARKKSFELLKGGSTQTDYIFQRFDHFTAESLANLAKKAFSFYSLTRSSFWVNMSSWVNMLTIYCVPVAIVNGIDVATIKQVVDMEPSGGKLPNSLVTVLMMPAAYDVQSKTLCVSQKTPFWGAAMWPGLRKAIQQTLSP